MHRQHSSVPAKRRRRLNLTGKQGMPGPAGQQGKSGPAGGQGVTGSPGVQGPPGLTGAQGIPGLAGAQGVPGAAGAPGTPGPVGAGISGATGATGIQGPTGTQGVSGSTGAQGVTGPSGPAFDIADIEIVPTAERYFYFAPEDIQSSVTIRVDQFSVDGAQEASPLFNVGSNSYANLYINGMIQESTLYSLTPSSVTIHLDEGETIHSGTPIIVEIVQFRARYSA
ncbi:DUF4183 domain-containing protein [Paenibacillus maysiensis]|uniref:DUF4183 domain-containing protein n=1 Tax=Paenibacillus maysiensis TaxID=1155954 RepID=UPI0004B147F7|nr:DUF4183 domain-containing protein [Paenibacillus maysiensis]